MDDTELQNDFAFLAVVDAYKWWINADFGFLQETGILNSEGNRSAAQVGKIDAKLMRRIAREYTVSRNIPAHSDDLEAATLVKALSNPALHRDLSKPFKARAEALIKFVADNPVSLAPNAKGEVKTRQLASALSKLTWFLSPEDWTIFDKFVGVAVLRKSTTSGKQMGSYYSTLAKNWNEVSSGLCQAAENHGLNPLLGYRIADKYLFCHGVGMFDPATGKLDGASTLREKAKHPSVLSLRKSLSATEKVLSQHMGHRLRAISAEVAPILARSGWV